MRKNCINKHVVCMQNTSKRQRTYERNNVYLKSCQRSPRYVEQLSRGLNKWRYWNYTSTIPARYLYYTCTFPHHHCRLSLRIKEAQHMACMALKRGGSHGGNMQHVSKTIILHKKFLKNLNNPAVYLCFVTVT